MKLYLVRHGQTDLNRVRRYQGRIDVPLNETGIGQARQLAVRLSSEPFDAIYASPLARAHETARLIHDGRSIAIITSPELVEMDFGRLEGKTYQEIIGIFPAGPRRVRFSFGQKLADLAVHAFFHDILRKGRIKIWRPSSGCLRVFFPFCLV